MLGVPRRCDIATGHEREMSLPEGGRSSGQGMEIGHCPRICGGRWLVLGPGGVGRWDTRCQVEGRLDGRAGGGSCGECQGWWVGVNHRVCQGVFTEISTMPWFTLFAPLVCLLLIRAIRDLVDDIVSGVMGLLGRGLRVRWGPFLASTRDRCKYMTLWPLLPIAIVPAVPTFPIRVPGQMWLVWAHYRGHMYELELLCT